MTIRANTVRVLSIADQSGLGYSPYFSGYIESIQYVKTDYANGVDFTITSEATGEAIWVESNVDLAATKHVRAATHTVLGAAALWVAAGEAVNDRIALARDRVKIVIASGGAAGKIGDFVITTSDT